MHRVGDRECTGGGVGVERVTVHVYDWGCGYRDSVCVHLCVLREREKEREGVCMCVFVVRERVCITCKCL